MELPVNSPLSREGQREIQLKNHISRACFSCTIYHSEGTYTCSACGSLQWLQWVWSHGARLCSGHTEGGGGGEECHSMQCEVPLTKERGWTSSVNERGQRGIKTCAGIYKGIWHLIQLPTDMAYQLSQPLRLRQQLLRRAETAPQEEAALLRETLHLQSTCDVCMQTVSQHMMSMLLLRVSLAGLLACL